MKPRQAVGQQVLQSLGVFRAPLRPDALRDPMCESCGARRAGGGAADLRGNGRGPLVPIRILSPEQQRRLVQYFLDRSADAVAVCRCSKMSAMCRKAARARRYHERARCRKHARVRREELRRARAHWRSMCRSGRSPDEMATRVSCVVTLIEFQSHGRRSKGLLMLWAEGYSTEDRFSGKAAVSASAAPYTE